jgi:hypothetical protein
MLIFILEMIGVVLGFLVLAGLARRYGAHTLINGFMSPEKADAVFPYWRKHQPSSNESKKEEKNN